MPPNNRLDPEELKMAEQPVTDGYYMSVGEVSGDPFKVLVNLEDDMRLTLAAVRQAGNRSMHWRPTCVNLWEGIKYPFAKLRWRPKRPSKSFINC